MKKRILSLLLAMALCGNGCINALAAGDKKSGDTGSANHADWTLTMSKRERLNFNQGWKFVKQNIPEAISPDYDLTELKRWENVDLPHSLNLEPLHGDAKNATYQGECMYVKHFPIAASEQGKKLYIEFEGVMGVTDVWINGTHMNTALADHAPAEPDNANTNYGGYLPFIIDITDAVKYDGTDNVITVLADNQDNGDVPPGKPQASLDFTYFGGIYRNVWLESTSPIHITDELFENIAGGGGILVEYPAVSAETAMVSPKTHIRNETNAAQNVTLKSELFDRDSTSVGSATETKEITANGDYTFDQDISVTNPRLWDLDDPYLHTLVSTVTVNGTEVDRVETTVGIRKFTIDREKGLLINGEVAPLLSGGNRHQDYPIIGNAAPDSLQYRDAVEFKQAGFNVVRAAHYPMSEEFVKACDELGLLLYEATPGWQWYPETDVFDLRVRDNIRQLIRRDRNRPCMLAYEIVLNESYNVPQGYTRESARIAREEQPEALIATEGQLYDNSLDGKDDYADIMFGRPGDGTMEHATKALGFVREYGDFYAEDHGDFKARRTARGTREQTGAFYPGGEGRMLQQANDRLFSWDFKKGIYDHDDSLLSQYQYRNANKAYIGGTMWTAQDNRGYGSKMSLTGIWDPYRLPKFAYYAYESQRPAKTDAYLESKGVESGPSLFIASYWGEKAPDIDVALYGEQPIGTDAAREIYVYSNAATVTLTVEKDGKALWTSEKKTPLTNADYADIELLPHPPFEFKAVPYTTGSTLKAVGYDTDGSQIAEQSVKTAGAPARIRLEAAKDGVELTADGSDLMLVYAYVVDAQDNVCPEAGNRIAFSAQNDAGDAAIVGDGIKRVGANPVNAEAGIAAAYVQAGKTAGNIKVTAASDGLTSGTLTINAQAMQEPAAAYTEIPREGAGMDEGSMYLASKENSYVGEGVASNHTLTFGADSYEHCVQADQAYVEYELGGGYQRLTTKVGVPAGAENNVPAVFKVYADGALRYVSEPVSDGQVAAKEIDLDIAGTQTLRLVTESADKRLLNGAWLSPYVYEGKGLPDNSELYKTNYALHQPATATHGEASAANAVDGNSDSLWTGDVYSEGTNQSITVDLGEVKKIRNTKIALGVDNTIYDYTVYTSANQTDWIKRAAASRSGWTNAANYMDEFAAEARYIKIEFTKVSTGQAPQVREIETYPDLGVSSVMEYNLKGLSVEGKNIVFDPSQTAYAIALEGYETAFTVRALAADAQAAVSINGQPVTDSGAADSLFDAAPVTVDALDEDGNIVIEVVPASGTGKKVYTVHVNGDFGISYANRFDTAACFVPGHNGANHWTYEEYSAAEQAYVPIGDEAFTYYQGDGYWAGSEEWSRVGPVFMHPGDNNAYDAVKTFTAPKSGEIKLTSHITSQGGGVKVKVLHNEEQIWPADGDGKVIVSGPEDIALTANVSEGDTIRLIVNANGKNSADATRMSAAVSYVTAADKVQDLISRMDAVRVINAGQASELQNLLAAYEALTEDEKAAVGANRAVKLREDIALAKLLGDGSARVSVFDRGPRGFDANASSETAALLEDAEQGQVMHGYFEIDNDGAAEHFNNVIGGDKSFTIEAMIRPNRIDVADANVIMSKGDNTATFRVWNSNLNFFIHNGTDWKNVDIENAFTAATAQQWHHVAAVYDGTNGGSISLYLDGALANSVENVGSVNSADIQKLCVGKDPVKGNNTQSDFRYVRVYSEALTKADLNAADADKLARDSVQLWYDFSDTVYAGTGAAEDIRLNTSELTLAPQEQADIEAAMVPYYAEDTLLYTSNDESVVSVDASGHLTAVAEGTAEVTVSLTNGSAEKAIAVTVGTPSSGDIPVSGVTLDQTAVTLYHNRTSDNTVRLTATVEPSNAANRAVVWRSSDDTVATVSDGCVTAVAEGTAAITVTTEDGGFEAVCTVTVKTYSDGSSSGGGSPSGSGGSSGDKTENKKNPDGSTTTIVTKPDGSKTETTKKPDGTTEVVETKKDGTISTTTTTADGMRGEAITTTDGKTTASVTIPKKAVEDGKPVALPLPELKAEKDAEKAPVINLSTPGGKKAIVIIPVSNVGPGVVAVTIKPDGTEEIVKTAVPAKDGLKLSAEGTCIWKLVDNTKTFIDVSESNWAADSVTFVTAREIFSGTSADSFSPSANMTRAMLMTVLARTDGQDTSGGASWYDKGMRWAKEHGISDGTNPNGNISREQLATMLYRYAGSPQVSGASLNGFSDQDSVSGFAANAMLWAVQQRIITGKTAATLDPQGLATRAEVSAMLMRYLKTE
ncbi:MAG: S-layer homology domain-containing protein [Eubacteriales bacterium]|nr:S-layer homology domain-containing protein [Eubacteriales bacterium]